MPQPLLQILDTGRQTEDGHDLRGHDDVEAVLARIAVRGSSEPNDDLAQGAVVHIDHAPPGNPAHVKAELVALVDVVVDERRQEIVGECDRGEVTREVQVDVLHWNDLRMAAAGRASLHAEDGPEGRLAQTDDRFLADAVERIAQADRGRGLAFTCGRRGDRRHEDQLAVGPVLQRADIAQRDLGLEPAVRLEVLLGDAEPLFRESENRLHFGSLRNLDIGRRRCHSSRSSFVFGSWQM